MATFQGFWHGPPLGPLRSSCLASFIAHGHSFRLYCYEAPIDLPSGVETLDANSIIPVEQLILFENTDFEERIDLGPFSDLFRFKLLREKGGWWSDVDTVCLNMNIDEPELAWAQENPEWKPKAIGTSQIALPASHWFSRCVYDECLLLSKTRFKRQELGPHLLSKLIAMHGLDANVYGTPATFYPLRWIEMFKLWIPEFSLEVKRKTANSYFLPIYQSFPKWLGLDLAKAPPIGSYLYDFVDYSGLCNRDYLESAYTTDEVLSGLKRFLSSNKGWAVQELRAICGEKLLIELASK